MTLVIKGLPPTEVEPTIRLGNHGNVTVAEAKLLEVPDVFKAEAALLVREMVAWIPDDPDAEHFLRLGSQMLGLTRYQQGENGIYSVNHKPNAHDKMALPRKLQTDSLIIGPDKVPYGDLHFYDHTVLDRDGSPHPGISHPLRPFDWNNTLIPVRQALGESPRLLTRGK